MLDKLKEIEKVCVGVFGGDHGSGRSGRLACGKRWAQFAADAGLCRVWVNSQRKRNQLSARRRTV
jgi:hypothetical protein